MQGSESPRIGTGESLEGRSMGRGPRIESGETLEGRSLEDGEVSMDHGSLEQDLDARPGYAIQAGAHNTAWTMLCRTP